MSVLLAAGRGADVLWFVAFVAMALLIVTVVIWWDEIAHLAYRLAYPETSREDARHAGFLSGGAGKHEVCVPHRKGTTAYYAWMCGHAEGVLQLRKNRRADWKKLSNGLHEARRKDAAKACRLAAELDAERNKNSELAAQLDHERKWLSVWRDRAESVRQRLESMESAGAASESAVREAVLREREECAALADGAADRSADMAESVTDDGAYGQIMAAYFAARAEGRRCLAEEIRARTNQGVSQ